MRLGSHLSVGGGKFKALESAKELGIDSLQIFVRNVRGWVSKPLDQEDIDKFKTNSGNKKIKPLYKKENSIPVKDKKLEKRLEKIETKIEKIIKEIKRLQSVIKTNERKGKYNETNNTQKHTTK